MFSCIRRVEKGASRRPCLCGHYGVNKNAMTYGAPLFDLTCLPPPLKKTNQLIRYGKAQLLSLNDTLLSWFQCDNEQGFQTVGAFKSINLLNCMYKNDSVTHQCQHSNRRSRTLFRRGGMEHPSRITRALVHRYFVG